MAPARRRASTAPRTVEAPHLPGDLTPETAAELGDDSEWTDLDVSGVVDRPDHVAGVDITACRLNGLRLTGASFDRLRLVDVLVEGCELAGTILERCTLSRVEFRDCRISGLVAPGLVAGDVRFSACKLDGASFRMSSWDRLTMQDCDLEGTDFYEASLTGARLLGSNLTGADFSRASMAGTALHGSRLDGIRGGEGLRGVIIGPEQMMALSLAVFATLGIRVDDGDSP